MHLHNRRNRRRSSVPPMCEGERSDGLPVLGRRVHDNRPTGRSQPSARRGMWIVAIMVTLRPRGSHQVQLGAHDCLSRVQKTTALWDAEDRRVISTRPDLSHVEACDQGVIVIATNAIGFDHDGFDHDGFDHSEQPYRCTLGMNFTWLKDIPCEVRGARPIPGQCRFFPNHHACSLGHFARHSQPERTAGDGAKSSSAWRRRPKHEWRRCRGAKAAPPGVRADGPRPRPGER